MKIGVPKEIISQEYRVAINPETAKLLIESSHQLFIQKNAGDGSGYSDQDYESLGCTIVDTPSEVFTNSDLILDAIELLKKSKGGKGKLISGTSLSDPANVLIIGAGIVGVNAMQMSLGLGANTTILDINNELLRSIKTQYPAVNIGTSSKELIEGLLPIADIVIGAVLTPGAKPPTVISREMLSLMQPKSILSDVAIDQGGCFETSKVTSHSEPTYEVDDIIHYCVRNIPSAVPFTATNALNESTRPFIARLANDGVEGLKSNTNLLMALNTHQGHLVNQEVADAHDLKYSNPSNIL